MRIDEAAIERSLRTYRLILPRAAMAGRVGGIAGSHAGGALEIHDFREYQPGDDLRQLDWNAVARTSQLIVRTRREEVTPRLELIVDASRSMALTPSKRARTIELAVLLTGIARLQGLAPTLIVVRSTPEALRGLRLEHVESIELDGTVPLDVALRRRAVLRSCGVRVVLSDFLFEATFDAFCGATARNAAAVHFVQVLDAEDLDPTTGEGAKLIDSESEESLDRLLTPGALAAYRKRLAAHQAQIASSARRARTSFCHCVAQDAMEDVLRRRLLGQVLEVRA